MLNTQIRLVPTLTITKKKSKVIPRQAEVALGVPVRLRPWIFSTFGTTRVVGRQPNAPAAFNPGEIPGTHFQRLSRPKGTWFCRKEPRKKSQVTPPGIDPGTVRLVAHRLNRYTTRMVLLESCLQTCMTYTNAEYTVNKLLMMGRGTARKV